MGLLVGCWFCGVSFVRWVACSYAFLATSALLMLLFFYQSDRLLSPLVVVRAVGHQRYWGSQHSFVWGGCGAARKALMRSCHFSVDCYTEKVAGAPGIMRLLRTGAHFLWFTQIPLRVVCTSGDVVHSFNVKRLGISLDSILGRAQVKVLRVLGLGGLVWAVRLGIRGFSFALVSQYWNFFLVLGLFSFL